jgi:hypothetical protein
MARRVFRPQTERDSRLLNIRAGFKSGRVNFPFDTVQAGACGGSAFDTAAGLNRPVTRLQRRMACRSSNNE